MMTKLVEEQRGGTFWSTNFQNLNGNAPKGRDDLLYQRTMRMKVWKHVIKKNLDFGEAGINLKPCSTLSEFHLANEDMAVCASPTLGQWKCSAQGHFSPLLFAGVWNGPTLIFANWIWNRKSYTLASDLGTSEYTQIWFPIVGEDPSHLVLLTNPEHWWLPLSQ